MKIIKKFDISKLEDNFKKQVCEKINNLISNQEEIIKIINKPVETTNEQPYRHDNRNLSSDDM